MKQESAITLDLPLNSGEVSTADAYGSNVEITAQLYPTAAATHEQVVADSSLFFSTLIELLGYLGLTLKVPKIAGQEIDVHRLYVEVTKLGGLKEVIRRKLFATVCEPFHFPPSFTNKSYVVRKLYCSVLHHYEQVYYFQRGNCELVPVPVSEHQQAARGSRQQQNISPSKHCVPGRIKPGMARNPITPRGTSIPAGNLKSAIGAFACTSQVCSPVGKRKQADGMPFGMPAMPAQLGYGLSVPSLPCGFKPLLHATNIGNKEQPELAAANGNQPRNVAEESPTTSCTSGTPQISPPTLAPPGLEAGTEFPCRIEAVYEHYYIISMHVPGIATPLLGQLVKGLPYGMSIAPNILPHQLIYEPHAKTGSRTTTAGTGPSAGSSYQVSSRPGLAPYQGKAEAVVKTAGMPGFGVQSQHSGAGTRSNGTAGSSGAGDSGLASGDTQVAAAFNNGMQHMVPGAHNFPESWVEAGPNGHSIGGLGVVESDTMNAPYSPRSQQEAAKKLRLRSSGGYAVIGANAQAWAQDPRYNQPGVLQVATTNSYYNTNNAPTAMTCIGQDTITYPEMNTMQVTSPNRSAFTYFMLSLASSNVDQLQGRPLHDVAADMWAAMDATDKAYYQDMACRDQERSANHNVRYQQQQLSMMARQRQNSGNVPHQTGNTPRASSMRQGGLDNCSNAGSDAAETIAHFSDPSSNDKATPRHSDDMIPVPHGAYPTDKQQMQASALHMNAPSSPHLHPAANAESPGSARYQAMAGQQRANNPTTAGLLSMQQEHNMSLTMHSPGRTIGHLQTRPSIPCSPRLAGPAVRYPDNTTNQAGNITFNDVFTQSKTPTRSKLAAMSPPFFGDNQLGFAAAGIPAAPTMQGQAKPNAAAFTLRCMVGANERQAPLRVIDVPAPDSTPPLHLSPRKPAGMMGVVTTPPVGAPSLPPKPWPSHNQQQARDVNCNAAGSLAMRPPPLGAPEEEVDEDRMLPLLAHEPVNISAELFCRMDISGGGAGFPSPCMQGTGPRISGVHMAGGVPAAEAAAAFAAAMHAQTQDGNDRYASLSEHDDMGCAADLLLSNLDDTDAIIPSIGCSLDGTTDGLHSVLHAFSGPPSNDIDKKINCFSLGSPSGHAQITAIATDLLRSDQFDDDASSPRVLSGKHQGHDLVKSINMAVSDSMVCSPGFA